MMTACRDKIRPAIIPFFEIIRDVEPGKHVAVVRVAPGFSVHSVWHNSGSTYYGGCIVAERLGGGYRVSQMVGKAGHLGPQGQHSMSLWKWLAGKSRASPELPSSGIGGGADASAHGGIVVRRPARTGDTFVDECFECSWLELNEPRDWFDVPDLELVRTLAKDSGSDAALAQLEKIWSRYSDHDFVYLWKAELEAKKGNKTKAINTLDVGLEKARRKDSLCSTRAMIEYRDGNIRDAVLWWIRSAVSQISVKDPISENPFLYLAYVAQAFGDYKSRDQLFSVVDRLTRFGRLGDSAQSCINSMISSQGNKSMMVAVALLCNEFIKST
jgi:hypothetical protein